MKQGFCAAIAALFMLAFSTPAAAQAVDDKLDAQVYIGGNTPPDVATRSNGATYSTYSGDYATPSSGYTIPKAAYYERVLAVWKDPLTLPHSRSECAKWASGHIPFDGDWKTCIGWKVQWQWMYDRATLTVNAPNAGDINKAVQVCLGTAAVAAAAAAIVTGSSAAIATFEEVMKGCLAGSLGSSVGVHVRTESYWGDWE